MALPFWWSKKHKKWAPLNTSKNNDKSSLGRPRLRFGTIFYGSWHTFFINFHDLAKPLKLQQGQCEMLVLVPHFGIENPSEIYVFKTPSWIIFLLILCWFYKKIIDFGTPSKSSGRPNRIPNRPSDVQNLIRSSSGGRLFPVQICFYMLVALWFSFATLLVPVGYLLLHWRYHFQ